MSIPTLQKHDNGVYYAHWTEGRRGKRASLGTKDAAQAERRFAKWLTVRNEIAATGAPAMTVAELWAEYEIRHINVNVASAATLRQSWAKMEKPFGRLLPSELTEDKIMKFTTDRQDGVIGRPAKLSTIRRELNALVACLNWCADPRRRPALIGRDELPIIDLPPEGEPREKWLSMGEIGQLMASAAAMRTDSRMSRGERFLWIALETAAREQAILELTWDRVDFEIGIIDFNVPGRKRTKKRRVTVPISGTLRPILLRAHAERVNNFVLDSKSRMWSTIQTIANNSGLVEKQKHPTGTKLKATGISPHVLRHTAATQMARRGVPLFDIAGILGNTLAMVEKVYAKHCPNRLRAAVNSISEGKLEAAE
ncbi:MAG: site-specific integrase [Hyphomicrobium sp.]|jgi:integrase